MALDKAQKFLEATKDKVDKKTVYMRQKIGRLSDSIVEYLDNQCTHPETWDNIGAIITRRKLEDEHFKQNFTCATEMAMLQKDIKAKAAKVASLGKPKK